MEYTYFASSAKAAAYALKKEAFADVMGLVSSGYDTIPYHTARRSSMSDEEKAVAMFKAVSEKLSKDDISREYDRLSVYREAAARDQGIGAPYGIQHMS